MKRQSGKSENDAENIILLNFALDHVLDEVFLIDENACIHYANATACRLLGYSRDELLGMRVADIDPDFPLARWPGHWQKLRTSKGLVIESRHKKKDGSIFPVEISINYLEYKGRGYNLALARDITERRTSEEALRESEAQLRSLSENLAEGMVYQISSGPDGKERRFTYLSPAVERFHGLKVEEVLQNPLLLYNQVTEEDRALVAEREAHAYATRTRFDADVRVCLPSGELRWRHFASSPRFCSDGSVVWDGIEIDITERKQSEKAMRDSETRMRSIIEAVPMGMHIYRLEEDNRLVFIGANPAADRILGVDNRIFVGKSIEEAFPPLVDTEVPQRYREAAATGAQWHAEQIDYDRGDIKGAFEVTAFQISPCLMAAVFTEITDRKRTEKALRDSESRLRVIMENAPDTILQVDRQGTISFVNRPLPGLTVEQIVGTSVYQWVPKDNHAVVERALSDAFTTGTRQEYESTGPGPNGLVRFYAVRVMPVLVEGKAESAIYIATDITERKKAEKNVRESEAQFRRLVEQSPIAISIIDGSGHVEYSNKKHNEIVGYTAEEVPNLEMWWSLAYPDSEIQERIKTAWEKISLKVLNGEDVGPIERTIVCKDGSRKDMEMRFSLVGEKILAVFNDISDRKKLEEERLKSQKLESIGVLAGGIAHDFNNLLQGIFGYISLAKMNIDAKARSLEMLEQAEKALHLSVNLTTQLLTFSKGGKPVKKPMQLRPVIENTVKFALSGSRSGYRLDLAENLLNVEADAGQIAQVIQNIVLNADQAMPLGGTVLISARNMLPLAKKQKGFPEEVGYVEVAISDSGVGIPQQYLSHIFDPYFTTKEKGSGIGLATTYSIIKNHGGMIQVESEVGKGTAFHIYLPGIESDEESMTAMAVSSLTRPCRVLVMDDDVLIRDLMREMIKVLGHEVVCVPDGGSAVAEYRASMESGDVYDAVILDLTVRGGMGGEEAVRRLLALDPHVKAIVSSGYSESSSMSDYQAYGFKGCLSKPYRIDELRNMLSSLLS